MENKCEQKTFAEAFALQNCVAMSGEYIDCNRKLLLFNMFHPTNKFTGHLLADKRIEMK